MPRRSVVKTRCAWCKRSLPFDPMAWTFAKAWHVPHRYGNAKSAWRCPSCTVKDVRAGAAIDHA